MIQRPSGGAQSGRAAAAEKALEAMKEEGLVEKRQCKVELFFCFHPADMLSFASAVQTQ